MRVGSLLSGTLALMPSIYLTALSLSLVRATPFTVLGILSLPSVFLPLRYQNLGILMIYAPAIYSIYEMLMGRGQFLMELAGCYVLSLPILSAFSLLRGSTTSGVLGSYLSSVVSGAIVYGGVNAAKGDPKMVLYSLVQAIISPAEFEGNALNEQTLMYLTPLVAISLVALVVHLHLRIGGGAEPFYRPVMVAGAGAVGLTAVTVLYSLLFEDVTLFILLLASFAVVTSGLVAFALGRG
ncbi:MAG: hypothetical protein NYU90_08220 [Aigarchaeota archaeon]|nr:hypothetical protein [Candidatus Calditenuis fumarioli]